MNTQRGRAPGRLKRAIVFCLLAAAATVLVLSIPAVSDRFVDTLQLYPALTKFQIDEAAKSPGMAIVVLSAGRRIYAPEFGGETVDAVTLERLRYGADLARRTKLPVLVSGGLADPPEPSLAKLMADALSRDFEIAPKWQEGLSSNTAENAFYSARLLRQAGIDRILLVTHAWHMPRARDAFAANGITVIPAPTAFYGRSPRSLWRRLAPSTNALRMSGFAIHETLGRQWYAWRYGY